MHIFFLPKLLWKHTHISKLWVEGVWEGKAGSRHTILLLTPHPTVPPAGEASPTQLAATAKSLDTRKASVDVPKVSALVDTRSHFIYTQSHLKHKWPKLQKSEVQMSCIPVAFSSTLLPHWKLPFLRSRSPSHHRRRSPCSHSSLCLLLSLNPSLQISGTCWHRCVYPSHVAP